MAAPTGGAARHDERGTAIVGTLFGFTMFLLFLLLAVQVLVRLYATSVLTSAGNSAARQVASAPNQVAAIPAAQQEAAGSLGAWGRKDVRFTWVEVDGAQVVLRVAAPAPVFVNLLGLGPIVRTVTVRTERFR